MRGWRRPPSPAGTPSGGIRPRAAPPPPRRPARNALPGWSCGRLRGWVRDGMGVVGVGAGAHPRDDVALVGDDLGLELAEGAAANARLLGDTGEQGPPARSEPFAH